VKTAKNKEECQMAKKENIEEVIENVEDVEVQTSFNEDGLDILCAEDTIVENINAEEGE
jgi:hypothetical protein